LRDDNERDDNEKVRPMPSVIALIVIGGIAAVLWGPPAAAQSLATQCARNAGQGDIRACRQALAQQPGDLALRRHLAHSLAIMADYQAAIGVLRNIATERPNDPRAHFDLAGLLGAIRRYAEAAPPIEAAIRLDPENILAYQAAAVIYAQIGRMKDAVAITNRAAARGDTASMYEMSLYYQDGVGVRVNNEKAFYWARQAAERDHVAAMQRMSAIYLNGLLDQKRAPEKAIEWAQRVRAISSWAEK
jgi:TPR repeat protein